MKIERFKSSYILSNRNGEGRTVSNCLSLILSSLFLFYIDEDGRTKHGRKNNDRRE